MGWYCHPDTLTMAQAEALTRRRTQAERGTVEYLKVYRTAYADAAGGSFTASLERYLAELDAEIAGATPQALAQSPEKDLEALPAPLASAPGHLNPFQHAGPPEELAALIVSMMPRAPSPGQKAPE